MAIAAVNTGFAPAVITLPLGHRSTLDIPIPATGAGNDLVIGVDIGDDPNPPESVVSIAVPFETLLLETGDHLLLETGSKMLLESSSNVASSVAFASKVALTNSTARAEIWSGRNIEAGLTRLRITFSAPTVAGGVSEEYSGVQALGTTQTASGAGADPSISLTTQDNNNWVAATLAKEQTAVPFFTGALVGVSRATVYEAGDGAPDVAGIFIDNTSGIPAAVTCQGANASPGANWAGVALELRTVAPAPAGGARNVFPSWMRRWWILDMRN